MLHLAQSGTQNPLVPNLTELILGAFAFFLIFGVLAKILLPRISKVLTERTDAIEGGLQRAEEAQAEAQRVLEQYRAQLADARQEASRLREEAREQGAQIIAEMREQASAEARRLVQAAHSQIEADRAQALQTLKAEVGSLAVDLAGRVVGESLSDEARQRRTVERFLTELEQQPEAAAR
ncbi:MAG: F0F1 ATP synthase subunit B [Nocardiopsaceae bacterium]|jgi:F-type H+-transporting ATPase subunit b|nr:F0F1 ATP synthase subunit B [Nocardiopsaceae bacterium]